MRFAASFRVLGILLMLYSFTMLVPIVIAEIYHEHNQLTFLISFALTLGCGLLMFLPTARNRRDLRTRDGFLITSLFWAVFGVFGALPFMIDGSLHAAPVDAIFESISGFTTTGSTVLTGLDTLPKSLLFYRQQIQWLGGIGIVVIAIAILPMLGVGGMQLYRAETPGPIKDAKLTPRLAETAKFLFAVYAALTVACAVSYDVLGMSHFDAICHAFSTLSTAGFSTHDASFGWFHNSAIDYAGVLFMFMGGVNMSLHFLVWRKRSVLEYFRDPEFRFYLAVIALISAIVVVYLRWRDVYNWSGSLEHGLFQTVSIITTTGYATTNFPAWPHFLPVLMLFGAFMGGCGGSTGGGIKAIRVLLMTRQGTRELKQLVHPSAVIPLKIGNRRVPAPVISAVWSFFAVYMFSFIVLLLALQACGLDYLTAFSAVTTTINNTGPGLGDVATYFGHLNDSAKWLLCVSMLLGRLEVFTLLVLFTPTFWRR